MQWEIFSNKFVLKQIFVSRKVCVKSVRVEIDIHLSSVNIEEVFEEYKINIKNERNGIQTRLYS